MHPLLLRWGDAAVTTYSLFMALAFFTGMGVWVREGRRFRIPGEPLVTLSLVAFFWGWVGARLLFVITQWRLYLQGEFHFFSLWEGGIVFLGGLIGGIAALYVLLPRYGISRKDAFNAAAPAIAFAHAVGRVGCFFNGCCYGHECDLPWAVTFSSPLSAAPHDVPLHPSQLYEMFSLLVIGYVLMLHNRRPFFALQTWKLYLVLYSVARFAIEFTRGDTLRGEWGGFSTSQWICLTLILTVVWLDFARAKGHNQPHES